MSTPCIRVARGLLLYGEQIRDGTLDQRGLLKLIGVNGSTFRTAAADIGAKQGDPGLRFFDTAGPKHLAFGPGAGLAVGVSVGSQSLRATLVDANGWTRYEYDSEHLPDQLERRPSEILDRISESVHEVLAPALENPSLLVGRELPLLGVAVAWPCPVDRAKRPVGRALSHSAWGSGQPLHQRVSRRLRLGDAHSYALNDGHAAALAVAFSQTRTAQHGAQPLHRLGVVLRLASNINAATIIVRRPEEHHVYGWTSGFVTSILIGGEDSHAGEIGHAPIDRALVAKLNEDRPASLAPLSPCHCSCSASHETSPEHLEAYASVVALKRRIATTEPLDVVFRRVLAEPSHHPHRRALIDIGALVGEALIGPAAMLNPATVTLTGSLAVEVVREEVERRLSEAQPFGTHPDVIILDDHANKFIRAKGAALAIIRQEVYRKFEPLLGVPRGNLAATLRQHTTLLSDPLGTGSYSIGSP